ncbi:IS1 family transposase [Mesorhizobium sp. M0074]|uniref:IS1 family transposase n=1 Tax=Mesorhizobium sp. M0074 TaxID=2956869 RepID=UPI003336BAB7
MNKLPLTTRVQILSMLVEGASMRSVARVADVSFNTIAKLMIEAGEACAAYHDETVRNVQAKRVQCDEIWAFVAAKQKNVPNMKTPVDGAGDVWTWTALDADSKMIISYLVGGRDSEYALAFMDDVAARLANRVQMTTDGHRAYLEAVEGAFGADVDYAQLIKIYGASPDSAKGRYSPADCTGIKKNRIEGDPDIAHVSTSYVERMNLNIRMGNRRFTRLTNAFSKKIDNHLHMLSLYFCHYNFCRVHKTLRMSPAMAAGVSETLRDVEWIVSLIDAREAAPKRPATYRKTAPAL